MTVNGFLKGIQPLGLFLWILTSQIGVFLHENSGIFGQRQFLGFYQGIPGECQPSPTKESQKGLSRQTTGF